MTTLCIDAESRERFGHYWRQLSAHHPELTITEHVARPWQSIDPVVVCDGVLRWSDHPSPGAILLREEIYAAVAHVADEIPPLSLEAVRRMAVEATPQRPMVVGDDGTVGRSLLEMHSLPDTTIMLPDWRAAKEYVATHRGTWALVPWEVVDFRVQLLTIDGQRPDSADLSNYPFVRRLWLEDIALPHGFRADLMAALAACPRRPVTLVAVGDIMVGGPNRALLQRTSARYPFEGAGIRNLLLDADLTLGNLECAVTTRGRQQPKAYTFRADPEVVEGLWWAGFDILGLANNHTGDYGQIGLLDTFDALAAAGLRYIGAGHSIEKARRPQVVQVRDITIALLAYSQVGPQSFYATATGPGSAPLSKVRKDVREAKATADVVIVFCHWGNEYTAWRSAAQRALAQELAQAGADLVIGHHPHVVQGLAYESETLVVYSLGNFVFYPMSPAHTDEGVILRCHLDATGVKAFELIPYVISNSQPALASEKRAQSILGRIAHVTAAMGELPR